MALMNMLSKERLTLRSAPQGCVSKGGNEHIACHPSFETRATLAPQDEVILEFPIGMNATNAAVLAGALTAPTG